MHAVIALQSRSLPLVEGLELLLRRVATCFLITGIVGLVCRGIAPRLERLAEQHAAPRRGSGDQRIAVAEFVAERRIQKLFANNLLWGLVNVARIPNELLFDVDDKPTMDSQLEEGHSMRFATNPNTPDSRSAVDWEANLSKSVERLKSRVSKAERQLKVLRAIEAGVQSCGGWHSFMDTMEQRLRTTTMDEQL